MLCTNARQRVGGHPYGVRCNTSLMTRRSAPLCEGPVREEAAEFMANTVKKQTERVPHTELTRF